MALDVAYVVVLYLFVFAKYFRTSIHAPVYILGILFPASCLGKFVADYSEKKRSNEKACNGSSI
jgi:hypothetical protein